MNTVEGIAHTKKFLVPNISNAFKFNAFSNANKHLLCKSSNTFKALCSSFFFWGGGRGVGVVRSKNHLTFS